MNAYYTKDSEKIKKQKQDVIDEYKIGHGNHRTYKDKMCRTSLNSRTWTFELIFQLFFCMLSSKKRFSNPGYQLFKTWVLTKSDI
jgi:hypothetical protein